MPSPNLFNRLHVPAIATRQARFTDTFGLEGMFVLLYLSLLVTGIPLLVLYTPTAVSAGESIRTITYLAPYGWLLRNLHYWAAVLLLLTGMLHLLRMALTGGYKSPRRFNWLLGLAALLLSGLLSFSGYVLRWDVDTVGALTVIMNLAQQIPLLGDWLYGLLVGGAEISDVTLGRFYTWHIVGLSVPLLLLVGWRVFHVSRDGKKIGEGAALLALLCLLLGLALWLDAPLAPAVDGLSVPLTAVTPTITTPWFLLWIQALLRYLPPLWAGVVIPLAVVLILALLPWTLDRTLTGTAVWFNREGRLAQAVVLLLLGGIVALTLLEWWG